MSRKKVLNFRSHYTGDRSRGPQQHEYPQLQKLSQNLTQQGEKVKKYEHIMHIHHKHTADIMKYGQGKQSRTVQAEVNEDKVHISDSVFKQQGGGLPCYGPIFYQYRILIS